MSCAATGLSGRFRLFFCMQWAGIFNNSTLCCALLRKAYIFVILVLYIFILCLTLRATCSINLLLTLLFRSILLLNRCTGGVDSQPTPRSFKLPHMSSATCLLPVLGLRLLGLLSLSLLFLRVSGHYTCNFEDDTCTDDLIIVTDKDTFQVESFLLLEKIIRERSSTLHCIVHATSGFWLFEPYAEPFTSTTYSTLCRLFTKLKHSNMMNNVRQYYL